MLRSGSIIPVLLGFTVVIMGMGVLHASPSKKEAPTEEQWRTFNHAVIDQHIMPRYQQLTDNSLSMAEQVQHLCESRDIPALNAAQSSFKVAQASWQGIQHIQFGPVIMLMRNHSLQYWPDKKNIGAKQLSAILTSKDPIFDEEFFRSASISVQGFPALERLLFTNNNGIQQPNSVECALASAIAKHIHDTALAIQNEWKEEALLISQAGESDSQTEQFQAYEIPSEASTELMKSLVESIEVIRDNKLMQPLGESPEQSRWKKSESWRSEQSINNIKENISALHELYSGTQPVSVKSLLEGANDHERANTIESDFIAITKNLADLPAISGTNITAPLHHKLITISHQLEILQSNLEIAMQTLDIQLGFNSRDGD